MGGLGARRFEEDELADNPETTEAELAGLDETLKTLIIGIPKLVSDALKKAKLPTSEKHA